MLVFSALIAAIAAVSALPGQTAAGDTERLLKTISRSANRLLESATHFRAEETIRVRQMKGPDLWDTAQVRSELAYKMAADGFHETRRDLRTTGARIKPGIQDISQLLLLFATSSADRYQFERKGTNYVGAIAGVVFRYYQKDGPESLTVREGRKQMRERIHGEVWVRADGGGVVKVTLDSSRNSKNDKEIRDHAEVEYEVDPDGTPVPVSATYREYHNATLVSESIFSYKNLGGAAR